MLHFIHGHQREVDMLEECRKYTGAVSWVMGNPAHLRILLSVEVMRNFLLCTYNSLVDLPLGGYQQLVAGDEA